MKPLNKKKNNTIVLPETSDDKKHLKPEGAKLDLPEIKDIPGQEHIRPLLSGEIADTTISSADEEADYLFTNSEDELTERDNSNVSEEEKKLLRQSSESMSSEEDFDINNAQVDNIDEDGTALNEKTKRSGRDLDVPGSEDDDADEETGNEDEENNSYSLPDQ